MRTAMKLSALLALSLGLTAVLASDAEQDVEIADPDSKVVVLNSDSFKASIDHGLHLVEFYAPWCGHCKKLLPEYEEAAKILHEKNVTLSKVDCTTETSLCSEQGVQGYPTLKVFRDGAFSTDYSSERTATGIVEFMTGQLLPAVSDVVDLHDFKQVGKVVVVGFFEGKDSASYAAFEKVANVNRNQYRFGAAFAAEVAKVAGVAAPAIVLYKQFDEKQNIFPENVPTDLLAVQGADSEEHFTEEIITKFVKANAIPLMDDIGPENYGKFVESGLPLAYLFIANDEEREKFGPRVEPIARKFRGKVNFVYIDAVQFGGHANNLNLKESWPAFAIENPQSHLKYPFSQENEITEEAIGKFVEDVLSGSLGPSIKSQPIPDSNDEPVKVIVADSYKDLVLDATKDVLLEFYAPWCGHCKRLAPIYETLATRLANVSSIVIAKMDATENDIPPDSDFVIEGFPTIKLFKSGDNTVVDYSGDRTEEAMVSFLKENVGTPFEVPPPVAPVAAKDSDVDEEADEDETMDFDNLEDSADEEIDHDEL